MTHVMYKLEMINIKVLIITVAAHQTAEIMIAIKVEAIVGVVTTAAATVAADIKIMKQIVLLLRIILTKTLEIIAVVNHKPVHLTTLTHKVISLRMEVPGKAEQMRLMIRSLGEVIMEIQILINHNIVSLRMTLEELEDLLEGPQEVLREDIMVDKVTAAAVINHEEMMLLMIRDRVEMIFQILMAQQQVK